MEKKTSYAEFSSQLNDKNIIIFEFGRQLTRCGFAGEPTPRAIVRSAIAGDSDSGKQVFLHSIENIQDLYWKLGQFIEDLYFNHLAVSPREKKVVVVESVFSRSSFRNTLTRILFDRFNVPSLMFVPDHLMALATLGSSTGLVVDIGSEEAVSVAVVEGVTLLNETQFAKIGAKEVERLIENELVTRNPSLSKILTPKIIEDIRIKACFVAPYHRGTKLSENKLSKLKRRQATVDANAPIRNTSVQDKYLLPDQDEHSPATVTYPVNGQSFVEVPGNLREGACEILFEIFGHEHSLTTLIIENILSVPIDCRRPLAQNILVLGGLSNLPGLEARLSEELKNIDDKERFRVKIPINFRFHKPICPRNYLAWLGASMFCTSCSLDLRSTSRDQWLREGRKNLRDWSDLIK